MNIFPHILVRIGGGSFDKLEQLVPAKTEKHLNSILAKKTKQFRLAEKINNELYQLIPSVSNPAAQKQLLNIKRDVFNRRPVRSTDVNSLKEYFSITLASIIEEYILLTEEIKVMNQEGEQLFQKDLAEIRKQFGYLVNGDKFKQGLLLSSNSLLDNIPNYLKTPSEKFRKKDYQTENGLVKYISRMYAKTSPFSTFTNLALGYAKTGNTKEASVNAEIPYVSHIRINNTLYQYIKTVLQKNAAVYRQFFLRINPTLTKKEDAYIFLTNHMNVEAFQSMPIDPLLELFIEISATKKEGFTYKELVEAIVVNEYIDATTEEIEGFVNQLLEYGFFEFNIGVSGIDPDWDRKLIQKLSPLAKGNDLVTHLIDSLEKVRALANEYETSSAEQRKKILTQAHETIRSSYIKLHEAAGLPEEERLPLIEYRKLQEQKLKAAQEEAKKKKEVNIAVQQEEESEKEIHEEKQEEEGNDFVFKQVSNTMFYFKPEQIFYEDTSSLITPAFEQNAITELIDSLHKLFQELRFTSGMWVERNSMLHFFLNKYGKEASIDLFKFYEDYFREFKKPAAERKRKAEEEAEKKKAEEEGKIKAEVSPEIAKEEEQKISEKNVIPNAPQIKILQEKFKSWKENFQLVFKEKIISSEQSNEVHFSLKEVQEIGGKAGTTNVYYPTNASNGAFVQFYNDSDQLKGVLNSSFPGYGKLISRFLHLFEENVTEDVRQWNLSLMGDSLFLENCDASYFNANLHPPLMPYEVWMPGSHNSLPEEKQIPITSLQVKWNEIENQLQLIHEPSQKRVHVFDLGFQGPGGRSELYQMLGKFMQSENIFVHHLINNINRLNNKDTEEVTKVIVNPRIIYDTKWILQRKAWFVPKELLPVRIPQENEWQYYLKVNEWKEKNNLPDEVFVYINENHLNQKVDKKAMNKLGRDDRKPQYISFKNPLLVDLFAKLCAKVPFSLKVEEMTPSSEQMLMLNEKPYVTESVVQWYVKDGK